MVLETTGILGMLAMSATLLALLMKLTRPRIAQPRRWLALAGGLFILLHLAFEGYRWQMTPVYALVALTSLTGLVFLIASLRAGRVAATDVPKRSLAARSVAVIGMLVLGVQTLAIGAFPVVRLPEPSGPYAVGTTFLHFLDHERPETLTDDPDDQREFRGRLWYPADVPSGAEPMAYQRYQTREHLIAPGGPPEFIFGHFHLSRANSYLDVPVSADRPAYPVLVFSVGFLNRLDDYQLLAEEFASRGYFVLIPDTPYESEAVRRPDESLVPYSNEHEEDFRRHEADIYPLWQRFWDDQTSASERDLIARQMLAADTFMDTALRIRVTDIQFAVDELQRINQAGNAGVGLRGRLDLSRLAVIGHSMGGAVAGQTCLADDRFKACVNLDGFQWGDVGDGEIQQPFMLIYSEQFEGGSDYILDNLKGLRYVLTVRGTKHGNFQDTPIVMPGSRLIGMAGSIDPRRMHRLTSDYLAYFLAETLDGETVPLSNGALPSYPEVALERQPASGSSESLQRDMSSGSVLSDDVRGRK